MLFILGWLISILLFGSLGGWLATKARLPMVVGVIVGAVFSVVGCVFLLGVWLAEDVVAWGEGLSR